MIKRYCDKCGKEIDGASYDVTLNAEVVEERSVGRQFAVGDYVLQLNFCPDCINETARTATALEKHIKNAIKKP